MPKINVFALSAPDQVQETRTLSGNGVEIEVTLRKMNMPETLSARERSNEVIRQYMGYDPDEAISIALPPPRTLVHSLPYEIKLSETLIQTCCMIECAQVGEEADRYFWNELAILSVSAPDLFSQIMAFFGEVQKTEKKSVTTD